MASQTITVTQKLSLPYKYRCAACGFVHERVLTLDVSGTASLGGSPFGRKERAEKEAKEKLQKALVYNITGFYWCCDHDYYQIVRKVQENNCEKCGQEFPWVSDLAKMNKQSVIKILFSKKTREESDALHNAINHLPADVVPQPMFPKETIIEQLGLQGIDPKPGKDEILNLPWGTKFLNN